MLETIVAFVSTVVGKEVGKVGWDFSDRWLDSSDRGRKGKRKERMVGRAETAEELCEEGYLLGAGDWGSHHERPEEWELGRLAGGRVAEDRVAVREVISVRVSAP